MWSPDYDMIDLDPILSKDELSDEDYATLYAQTGLTKIGVDRARKKGSAGLKRIRDIQKDYFAEYKIVHDSPAPFLCFCNIDGSVTNTYVEVGDVIVDPTTNLLGWRMGHSALISSTSGETVEIAAIGTQSRNGRIYSFTKSVAFMIVEPKVDAEIKKQVVEYAQENLMGIWYNPLRGVFSPKNEIGDTQCAHLVWYSYNKFGIDLDSNGGGIVTPQDIVNSDKVELVQVFGFDPVKLWK